MIGRPWPLSLSGRRLGEKACWRGVIEGLGRLDKTKSAPDGNTREMGLQTEVREVRQALERTWTVLVRPAP